MKLIDISIGKNSQKDIERGKYKRWRRRTKEAKVFICTLFALAEGICPMCGIAMFVSFDAKLAEDQRSATLDHITPLAQIKEHKKYGLQIMCKKCNNSKDSPHAR